MSSPSDVTFNDAAEETHKKIAIVVLSIFAIIIIILYIEYHNSSMAQHVAGFAPRANLSLGESHTKEDFATKTEKATTIVDWFQDNPSPKYNEYKKAMGGQSNIVEYESALGLYKDRNLTISSLENML
jgi:hypothetical protein